MWVRWHTSLLLSPTSNFPSLEYTSSHHSYFQDKRVSRLSLSPMRDSLSTWLPIHLAYIPIFLACSPFYYTCFLSNICLHVFLPCALSIIPPITIFNLSSPYFHYALTSLVHMAYSSHAYLLISHFHLNLFSCKCFPLFYHINSSLMRSLVLTPLSLYLLFFCFLDVPSCLYI